MPENESNDGQEPQESNENESNSTQSAEEGSEGNLADAPEWMRKQLQKANREAASYRTQLREAQESAKSAVAQAELDAIVKAVNDKLDATESRNRELEKKLIISDYHLSDDAADLIGDDPEKWEERAKKLSELSAPSNQPQGSGRLSGRQGTGAVTQTVSAAERAKAHFAAHRD